MDEKIIIRATTQSNLLKTIIDYMESEKIEYSVQENLLKMANNIKKVIFIDDDSQESSDFLENKNLSLILISDKKRIINSKLLTILLQT